MTAGAKVTAFTVVMLLVAAALVVVFGQFRFGAGERYHAQFADASRLKAGQDVRMAGLPVGKVDRVSLRPDNTVDVLFSVDSRYRLYTSTRAVIRYLNLTGDRYLELAFAAGELHVLAAGATIPLSNTQPAIDLDALLGGLRPVLKGLDGDKINAITAAVIDLLQGQGGTVSQLLSTTGNFTQNVSGRDQLIGGRQPRHRSRHRGFEEPAVQHQCRHAAEPADGSGTGPRHPGRRHRAARRIIGRTDPDARPFAATGPGCHRKCASLRAAGL